MSYQEKIEKQVEEWNERHEWIEVKLCRFYWNDYNNSLGFTFHESGRMVGKLDPNTQKFTPTDSAKIYDIDVKTMRIISEAVEFLFN